MFGFLCGRFLYWKGSRGGGGAPHVRLNTPALRGLSSTNYQPPSEHFCTPLRMHAHSKPHNTQLSKSDTHNRSRVLLAQKTTVIIRACVCLKQQPGMRMSLSALTIAVEWHARCGPGGSCRDRRACQTGGARRTLQVRQLWWVGVGL